MNKFEQIREGGVGDPKCPYDRAVVDTGFLRGSAPTQESHVPTYYLATF